MTLANSIELYSNAADTLNEIYYGSVAVIDSFEDMGKAFSIVPDPNIDTSWENINIANRFAQQAQSIKNSAEEIFDIQDKISTRASDMHILPVNAITDIMEIENRISELSGRLKEFGDIDISGFDPEDVNRVNAQFEKSRNLIANIRKAQDDINKAISENNVEAMNAGFGRLNSLANNLESTVTRTRSILEEPLLQQEQQPPTMPEPPPVEVPVVWRFDDTETPVFTETGVDRFNKELENANALMSRITENQSRINTNAISVMSEGETERLNALNTQIDYIRESIAGIESNPLNVGTDAANAGLEDLRERLNQALHVQEELNEAISDMDPEAANAAYQRLSGILNNTERYIRDNTDEQMTFNRAVSNGQTEADNLLNTIKGFVGAYVGIKTVGEVLDLSDTMTQTTARLDLIVDDGGSVDELEAKILTSAERARASYMTMTDAVSKMGMQAADAFSSNDELIAFTELLNKEFVIAGASAQGIDSVMLQLTQSMAAGKLQGEELNAVLDNAQPIVAAIKKYMEDVMNIDASNIKDLASKGQITAEVIKNAMFYAADDINQKFESMPMTFGQIWTSIKNNALTAFKPVLEQINNIANSPSFQSFVNMAVNAVGIVAGAVVNIFAIITSIADFIGEHWDIAAPIIYGLAAAFIFCTVAANAHAIAATAVKTAHMAVSMAAKAWTAAQNLLNGALLACPITGIILLIIALIAVIAVVCRHLAKTTELAQTGFGIFCGWVNVAIAGVKNLGLTVADIALGIWEAIKATAANIQTAFSNAIKNVQSNFYNLLSTALTVIGNIAEKLNSLPFIEFDFSGITGAAEEYAQKALELQEEKGDYVNIGDAFSKGMSTYETYKEGWLSEAFAAGSAWGDGMSGKISGMLDGLTGGFDSFEITNTDMPFEAANPTLANSEELDLAKQTADNTGDMADSLKKSEDILDMIKDSVSRERIASYTTKEIKIDMSGMSNNIASSLSIGDVVKKLANGIAEAAAASAEGV